MCVFCGWKTIRNLAMPQPNRDNVWMEWWFALCYLLSTKNRKNVIVKSAWIKHFNVRLNQSILLCIEGIRETESLEMASVIGLLWTIVTLVHEKCTFGRETGLQWRFWSKSMSKPTAQKIKLLLLKQHCENRWKIMRK